MKIKGLVIGGLVLALALSASFVMADDKGGGKEGKDGKGKWAEKLGLTTDQQTKMQDLQKDIQGKMKPLRDSDKDLLKQLKGLVDSKGSDSDISGVLDKLASNRTQEQVLDKQRADGMKQILTPTQQAQMVLGMAKKGMEKMKEWKDKKKGGEDQEKEDSGNDKGGDK